MTALVTVEEVKVGLRIDSSDDDTLLAALIAAASGAVVNYLKGQADVLLDLDSGGDMPSGSEAPDVIKNATVMLVGYFYRNPDGDPDKDYGYGLLPLPVMSLLYPLRDPALA